MSYQSGNVAYDRWQSGGQLSDPYYSQGSGNYSDRDANPSGAEYTRSEHDHHRHDGRGHQVVDSRQYQSEVPYRDGRNIDGYGYDRNTEPPHRYPQTFQNDPNSDPRRNQYSREGEGKIVDPNTNSYSVKRDSYPQYPEMDSNTNPYQQRYQSNQPPIRDQKYQEDQRRGDNANASPDRYRSPDRGSYPNHSSYDNAPDYPHDRYSQRAQDARPGYDRGPPVNVQPPNGELSQWDRNPQPRSIAPSYERDPQNIYEHEQNSHAPQYHGNDRNNASKYNDLPQHLDPPKIIAQTTGSAAVFGIARNNVPLSGQHRPPIQQNFSPARAQQPPVASPAKDNPPSFEPPRGNDSGRQFQHRQPSSVPSHQYHNALTPISEKASPTSSIGSKGHLQDNVRTMPQALHNQYTPYGSDERSWDPRADRSFPDRHIPTEAPRRGFEHSERSSQERHTHPQGPRHPYRDFETSSGYASESTHNTESSYGETQRQYDQRSPHFPPPPPEAHRDDRLHPTNEGYARSPPLQNPDYRRPQFDYPQPAIIAQWHRDRYSNHEQRDSYGPPARGPPPHDTNHQHGPEYDRQPKYPQDQQRYPRSPPVREDPPRSHYPPKQSRGDESGVVESHVPGVRAARSMFEQRSDPKQPPPIPKPLVAPKPFVAPKPNQANARPIPPRPAPVLTSPSWNKRDNRDRYPPEPYSEPGISATQPDARRQPYQVNQRPSHSQSMDNLDDRSRYYGSPPARVPGPHAQSMQNLNERPRPAPDTGVYAREPQNRGDRSDVNFDGPRPVREEYGRSDYPQTRRDNFQPPPPAIDDRPLVVAVKFNQDSGVSLHAAKEPPRRRVSWSDSNRQQPQRDDSYRDGNVGQSGPAEPPAAYSRRSYTDDRNWNNGPPNAQQSHPPSSRQPDNTREDKNYVPDIVSRSYELANQAQSSQGLDRYYQPRDERNMENTDRGARPQSVSRLTNQSTDRWPSPPPPISQEQARQIVRDAETHHHNQQAGSEDWRYTDTNATQLYSVPNRQSQHHANQPRPLPLVQIPSSAPQPNYDSESSEIDVDAPTPPPSKNRKPATLFDPPRGDSPYERNKPVPVVSRDPAESWRIVEEQPVINGDQPRHVSRPQPHNAQYLPDHEPSMSKNPPQKPHRNSTNLSPRLAQATVSDEFDVHAPQRLRNESSREKVRLGKSGALANRKPPSRHGSATNLLDIGNDDNYQIEVTDSDLSSTNNKMEVHRMESMRMLEPGKGRTTKHEATPIASEKTRKPPQKTKPAETKPEAKKPESKLVFKKPREEVAKTTPMPTITEPSDPPARRPPTYLGFGHTVEKPKPDILSQFKSAKTSAMRTAAEKQDKALKSVTALVKFNQGKGKKEEKKHPQPKTTPAERNARVLDKMNLEVSVPRDEHPTDKDRNPYHRNGNDRGNPGRNSTRSSSTAKHDKYEGDDDNSSRSERDRHGRGRDRHRDDDSAKHRGRSTSRGRNLSPDRRRGRSSSRGRDISPDRRRGRSTSRGRDLSPQRRTSKSRNRSPSPDDRYRPRSNYDERRYDDRRRRDDEPPYRRSHSPNRSRQDDWRHERDPHHHPHYGRDRGAREPDWVEQFRRGRDTGRSSGGQVRRAWVNDPRRVEVGVDGRRRVLDMDAFERQVKEATAYNSDFEQPPPRRQMIPSKLSAKRPPPNSKRKPPPSNWMDDLKERNRTAAKARFGRVPRY